MSSLLAATVLSGSAHVLICTTHHQFPKFESNTIIFYLASKAHFYTVSSYLSLWGKTLIPQVRLLSYEQLVETRTLQLGTYIFSDIERLTPEQAEMAAQVWKDISNAGKEISILNHPTRSMRRYELLRSLYEHGSNKFNIYRLTEYRKPQRFPVFIRGENDHHGSLTPLLQTPEELNAAINKIFEDGQNRENKVITEFCDTSDAKGIFRKYSAFIVGDQIIPRHVFFSHNWMLKYPPDLLDEVTLQEEWHYLKNNPHEPQLREIFRLARVNYGRIDYSLINGVLQVWEINTNPQILLRKFKQNRDDLRRVPLDGYFSQQLKLALEVIDCQAGSAIRIPTVVRAKFSKKMNTKQLITKSSRKGLKTLKQLPKLGGTQLGLNTSLIKLRRYLSNRLPSNTPNTLDPRAKPHT